MVTRKIPTSVEHVLIEVAEQMLKEERKPSVLAAIQRSGMRHVTNQDVTDAIIKLVSATDKDEGVTLTPWEAISIGAYLQHLELTIKGERYL